MMRKYVAEGLGTALLLVGVVGSGIMGQTLADGNTAIALWPMRWPRAVCFT